MKTPGDILHYHLSDLTQIDFKRFRDKLSDFHYNDKPPIPRGNLESTDPIDMKNMLLIVYGEDDALEVTSQVLCEIRLMGCVEKLRKDISTYERKQTTNLEDCRRKYMMYMQGKYKFIKDKNALSGEVVALSKRYTTLLMTKKHRTEKEREHEMISIGKKHLEIMENGALDANAKTSIEKLFDPDKNGEVPEIVVLQGPAGIGKTMTAQKIMLDWASGNLYQGTFNYLFYMSCREINNIKGKISISSFISKNCQLKCSKHLIKSILDEPQKLLFIIDGLDELKWQLQEETETCDDPFQETSKEILLDSLIRKHVLRETSLIITTRSFTLEELNGCILSFRNVEVMGFTGEKRKEYFHNFFENMEQANMALSITMENEILFTMCSVPITCWIVCTVLQQEMEKGFNVAHYKTTTSVYFLYVKSLIKYHGRDSNQAVLSCVKKLCALANYGIRKGKIIFEESDIEDYGLTMTDIKSIFLNKNLFKRDIECYTCCYFIHLSVQEFFAALYYVLIEDEDGSESPENLPSYREVMDLMGGFSYQLKLTVRFLFGLIGEGQKKEIEKIFKCNISKGTKSALGGWLRNRYSDKEKVNNHMDALNYLYETQEQDFVNKMMNDFMQLTFCNIERSDLDYRALCYCFMNTPRDDHTIDIAECVIDGKLQDILAPAIMKCTALHFRSSEFYDHWNIVSYNSDDTQPKHAKDYSKDSNISRLCLTGNKLQTLRFIGCELPSSCCVDLHNIIITNKSLIRLDLGHNKLQDAGFKLLCDGLSQENCNLQELGLRRCELSFTCCKDIQSFIIKNPSLIKLNLERNDLLDIGIEMIAEGLNDPNCTVQELSLAYCNLTVYCCYDIRSVIITNNSLISLDLAWNDLYNTGIEIICEGLKHPDCTLQQLSLWSCYLTTDGCNYLRSLFTTKTSLIKLELGSNKLEDSGVKVLCDGLRDPNCTLQELGLASCSLTSECCEDLRSVFIENTSLIKLDLSNNKLQESGIKLLCDGLINSSCTLKNLSLVSYDLTSACCEDLRNVIIMNRSLIKLNVGRKGLEESFIEQLIDALRDPTCTLQQLKLTDQWIDVKTFKESIGLKTITCPEIQHAANDTPETSTEVLHMPSLSTIPTETLLDPMDLDTTSEAPQSNTVEIEISSNEDHTLMSLNERNRRTKNKHKEIRETKSCCNLV